MGKLGRGGRPQQALTAQGYEDRRSLETPEHTTEECQLLALYDLTPFSNQWFSTLNSLGLALLILSAHVNQLGSLQVLGPNRRESDIFGLGREYC